jgi:hypothetical protein
LLGKLGVDRDVEQPVLPFEVNLRTPAIGSDSLPFSKTRSRPGFSVTSSLPSGDTPCPSGARAARGDSTLIGPASLWITSALAGETKPNATPNPQVQRDE